MLKQVRELFDQLAQSDVLEIQDNILTKNPNGFGAVETFGNARKSIGFLPTEKGYQIVSQGSAESYIATLERGKEPHYVNYLELVSWVEKKGIASGKQAKSTAFLIARSIMANGTLSWQNYGSKNKGTGILTSPASPEALDEKRKIIEERLRRIVQTQIKVVYGV